MHHLLHQGVGESAALGFRAKDGGRQLLVVSGKHHAVGLEDGGPAGSLNGLRGLVNEEGAEMAVVEQPVGAADERAGHHLGLLKHLLVDLQFELVAALQELLQPVGALPRGGAPLVDVANQLADAPQLGIVGTGGVESLVGVLHQWATDAQGVADAHHTHAPFDELLADPVHGGVARGADQHLRFAAGGLDDGLHQRGGLAGAGWTVHYGHLARLHDALHGLVLALVEALECHTRQRAEFWILRAYEDLSQMHGLVALQVFGPQESLFHHLVSGVVEVEAHPEVLFLRQS